MENDQRRSLRILFSIPVSVQGADKNGSPYETTGRTIILSRYGARIQVSHPLEPGQTIRVTNRSNDAEADFRVVGPVSPPLYRMDEWGVECLGEDANIWDIDFPHSTEDSDAHVLLECRRCRALALQSLSKVDVEVLETAGLLTLPCAHGAQFTPWGYMHRTLELETQVHQAGLTATTSGDPALTFERRKSYRKQEQLPVRVRDYFGEIEIAQTENISYGGFCFSSHRKYYLGQGIMVICPYDAAIEKLEARARIVRTGPVSSPERYTYGVRYEQTSH